MAIQEFRSDHDGRAVVVEIDQGAVLAYRVRLLVDGVPRDDRTLMFGTVRLHSGTADGPVVEVEMSFWGRTRRVELVAPDGPVPLERVS